MKPEDMPIIEKLDLSKCTPFDIEDYDGDDAIMIPISDVKCCGEWVGNELVYTPLVFVRKVMPESGSVLEHWECPVCKKGW